MTEKPARASLLPRRPRPAAAPPAAEVEAPPAAPPPVPEPEPEHCPEPVDFALWEPPAAPAGPTLAARLGEAWDEVAEGVANLASMLSEGWQDWGEGAGRLVRLTLGRVVPLSLLFGLLLLGMGVGRLLADHVR